MTEVRSIPRRLPRWWWVLLVVVAGTWAVWAMRSPMPRHQGKTVYEWMFESSSSDLDKNPGLKAIGSNAVPYLEKALATRNTPYDRYRWVRHRYTQGVITNLGFGLQWTRPSGEIRRAATWSLLAFDFEAAPALPELYAELKSPDAALPQMVIACIRAVGTPPEAIPHLVEAWPVRSNDSYVVRHDLLSTLGRAGSNAARLAMPIAIASLDDPKPGVQHVAANALSNWGVPAPQAIPKLASLISSTNVELAVACAAALGRITNRADASIPALRDLFARATNDFGRAVVTATLWRLGEEAEECRRTLESLLATKTGRRPAAEYLGEMGQAARESVSALLHASHVDLDAWVDMYDRAWCAIAVLKIQGNSAEAIGVLEEALAYSENGWIRGAVAERVGQLGMISVPLIAALRRTLNDPDREVRHEAAKALARIEALER